jgi:hypothetical protein
MEFEFFSGGAQRNPNCSLIANPVSNETIGLLLNTTPGVLGKAAIDAVQIISIVGDPFGGTFTLTFGGQTTSALAYNISLASLQSAVSSAGGWSSPTISGSYSAGFKVLWAGAGGARAAITSTASLNNAGVRKNISVVNYGGPGSDFRVELINKGGGPNSLDNKDNWSLGRCLNNGDTVIFDDSPSPALYGLDLSSKILVQKVAVGQVTQFLHESNRQVFDNDQIVTLLADDGVTAPGGMTLGASYTIADVGVSAVINSFTLKDSSGNGVIVTSPASGNIYLAVQNLNLKVYNRFTGAQIGLPHLRDGNAIEPLPQYMKAGFDSVVVGLGSGNGVNMVNLNTMASPPEITVSKTGRSLQESEPTVILLTNNDEVSLKVNSGSVGLAVFAGETSIIGDVEVLQGEFKASNSTLQSLIIAPDVETLLNDVTIVGPVSVG